MKQKKISREEYAKRYCSEKRIRDRKVLYVSAGTHYKIISIVHLFRNSYTTVSSFVEAILLHHIEQHKDLIHELMQKEYQELSANKRSDTWEQDEEEHDDDRDQENPSGT